MTPDPLADYHARYRIGFVDELVRDAVAAAVARQSFCERAFARGLVRRRLRGLVPDAVLDELLDAIAKGEG